MSQRTLSSIPKMQTSKRNKFKNQNDKKKKLKNADVPASNNGTHQQPKTRNNIIKSIQIMMKQKEALLTGVDPSKETLAREKDKFPAKKEPPL